VRCDKRIKGYKGIKVKWAKMQKILLSHLVDRADRNDASQATDEGGARADSPGRAA
jgi:hypothetical protein